MSTMNPKSFARLMKLLDLAAVDIAQALYVSPSHVSRWKTGSRELKTSRSYFEQLEELFLSVNAQHADGRLERFLLPEPADRPPEEREALMRQRLRAVPDSAGRRGAGRLSAPRRPGSGSGGGLSAGLRRSSSSLNMY